MPDEAMSPTLSTPRLLLRPFSAADAPLVRLLADDVRIAEQALSIPRPYPLEVAERWIATHRNAFASGSEVNFAVTLQAGGELLGTVSLLAISGQHARAELGYWIGARHWSKGYCTEAVLRLIDYGHKERGLTRITGRSLAGNDASVRVLEKAGLQCEGRLIRHVFKNDQYRDMLLFGRNFPERAACVMAGSRANSSKMASNHEGGDPVCF